MSVHQAIVTGQFAFVTRLAQNKWSAKFRALGADPCIQHTGQ
jgi:hypothetical protein